MRRILLINTLDYDGGAGPGLVLLPLVDHLTKLSVVQPVVPAGVELLKGDPDLLVSQVLTDCHELLNRGNYNYYNVLCSLLHIVCK